MATFDPRASTTQRPMVRHLGCSPSSLHSTDPHPRLKLYQVLSLPGWTAPAAPTLVSDLAGRGSQASLVRGGEPLVGQGACLCSGTVYTIHAGAACALSSSSIKVKYHTKDSSKDSKAFFSWWHGGYRATFGSRARSTVWLQSVALCLPCVHGNKDLDPFTESLVC